MHAGCVCRKVREQKIQELRWTHRTLPAHVRNNLSPAEQQYFRSYDQLLNKYMRSGRLGVGLDLTVVSGGDHSRLSVQFNRLCRTQLAGIVGQCCTWGPAMLW
jgi:hypothetical protein